MDKVDATMNSINEQRDLANEISNLISDPINAGLNFDEVRTPAKGPLSLSCVACLKIGGGVDNALPQTPARRTNSNWNWKSSSKTVSMSDSWAQITHQFTPRRRVPAASKLAIRRQRRPRTRNSRNCKPHSPCRDDDFLLVDPQLPSLVLS
jgi:hypothetical protein